jgi:hypothetical protein
VIRAVSLALAAGTLAALVPGAAHAGPVQPEPVVATSAREIQPAAALGYLAWTTGPARRFNQRVLWLKPDGEPKFRVNPAGTTAYVGPGAFDGTTLVHSLRKLKAPTPDLKLFDVVTKTRTNPPQGVNTRQGECCASLSGDWLLFMRSFANGRQQIILFNLATRVKRTVADVGPRVYVQPGSVEGDWAAWTRCQFSNRCATIRYNLTTKQRLVVANPQRKSQYAASVTADGTVYFAESSDINCGNGFGIWRYPVGGPRERLLTLPRRQDAIMTSPVVNPDDTVTVFFDRLRCATDTSDIYKVTVPAP